MQFQRSATQRSAAIGAVGLAAIALTLCVLVTIGVGLFPNLLVDAAEKGQPALVQYDRPAGAAAAPTGATSSGTGQ